MIKYIVIDGKFEKKDPPETLAVDFLRACEKGDFKIVQEILKKLSMLKDINVKDLPDSSDFQSALDSKNGHGQNGFLLACSNGHGKIIQEFLKYEDIAKELINETDMLKQTALHISSSKGYGNVVEPILSFCADNNISISARDDQDRSAYGLAQRENKKNVSKLFER